MQQLKLNIRHAPGCYSLVDTDGVVLQPNGVIQTAYYVPGDDAEKAAKLEQLIAFSHGLIEGWNMARNALSSPRLDTTVIHTNTADNPWIAATKG